MLTVERHEGHIELCWPGGKRVWADGVNLDLWSGREELILVQPDREECENDEVDNLTARERIELATYATTCWAERLKKLLEGFP